MLQEKPILLVPYDPVWVRKFEQEKVLIEEKLGNYITGGVHHVGSTSIKGLSAKPIIDIMVGVATLEKAIPCIQLVADLEYSYFPYRSESMHWFVKPNPERRTHHLYLIATSHPEYKARIAFRDYLRTHENERVEYELLKTKLVKKYANDREAYTEAKTQFVHAIVARASR